MSIAAVFNNNKYSSMQFGMCFFFLSFEIVISALIQVIFMYFLGKIP